MKRTLTLAALLVLAGGCGEQIDPAGPALSLGPDAATAPDASVRGGPVSRPFRLSHHDFRPAWAVDRNHELACGGAEVAGGATTGYGNFTHLGRAALSVSAAWNVGDLLDPADVRFDPVGPAGGPVAPVLGPGDYPYAFHFDPFTGQCGSVVSATGELTLTAANGDEVFGVVTGGETHRLDFVVPGDGAETFASIAIVGGTGRFQGATGAFVAHTVTRFDFVAGRFVLDLAELLPGGTIAY